MSEKYVKPIVESLVQTMGMMARMDVRYQDPERKKGDEAQGDLSGIMNLSSPKLKISIAISFSEEVIAHIAESMLPPTSQKSRGTYLDLVGEIANIVAGGAKQRFESLDASLQLSLPVIIYGQGHAIIHKSSGPTYIVPMNCDAGNFNLEVCYEEVE